ncbi:hydroxyisourate hydrolase [Thauera sp. Sel9]|uniref:hydroxyisourate hydrolase n=1 Tax=Thauera sp. Sel9 TaxID=2974299 RepID=UPI0021E163AD|nr:hydroxyisourate hydrolase [Thauera sp. Sel9]MCV2219728.1 hydroxyisourate hydrolase [Thauera sp. Sel9]
MAGITTHVLDTTSGMPGAGMRIDFSVLADGAYRLLKTVVTNADGRTDEMLLKPEETVVGHYELVFHVDDYYRRLGMRLPQPSFIGEVPVRFAVFDPAQHYHVPMLATPWSCATYRGS